VIAGPTAGGKSALAYALVERWRALGVESEIVSADAFQVYRGLDIGTAKPTRAEQTFVRHHLIDIVELLDSPSPGTKTTATERDARGSFTVSDWLGFAESAIADIRHRGRIPIVVGGTHLYVKALLEGLFEGPDPDPALRARLQARPITELRAELGQVDPRAAARIHPNDTRRTIRALEVYHQTGRTISEHQRQWDSGRARDDARLIGLEWSVEMLNRRINARVNEMMDLGLLDETRELVRTGAFGSTRADGPITPLQRQAAEALGYKQLLQHLRGQRSLEEAVEEIKIQTRRFAKNQRTWLKRLKTMQGSLWLTPHEALTRQQQATAWVKVLVECLN
jgi:tRNA dimethylallyltransferase